MVEVSSWPSTDLNCAPWSVHCKQHHTYSACRKSGLYASSLSLTLAGVTPGPRSLNFACMPFVNEDVPDTGPARLAEEHQRLVAWMKASRVGVMEYLTHRVVDADMPAALYYIEGLGMGAGQRFAMVRGDAIYLVCVYRDAEKPADDRSVSRVQEVSVPESTPMSRGAIESLLTEALRDYYEAHPYMMCMAFWSGTATAAFDWSATRWVVRPRKYSLLYWRTECAGWWQKFRFGSWPRIWGMVTSPLVAALSLAAFAWTGGTWLVVLAGTWLSWRLLQYEADWSLGAWMLGQRKYRNPFGHLLGLGRQMDPKPLPALKVRIERIDGEPMTRIVRVVNRSLVPVPYISIGASSLAELLAPGLIERLRQQGRQRNIDTKELERHFSPMEKKWLWPGQSFASRHHLLADFPLSVQPPQVQAVVDISRFVSGESRSGPTTFLLEVEESSP